MADLSFAAYAVLDAYMNNCGWLDGPLERDYRCAAAVLRAVAHEIDWESGDPKLLLENVATELENHQ